MCEKCEYQTYPLFIVWVMTNKNNNHFIRYCDISDMDQGEPGIDYDEPNLNPLVCDICNKSFDSLDKLGEHQKQEHDM